MEHKNKLTKKIDADVNLTLERLHYINVSYQSFLHILSREFALNKSKETSEMIEKYRTEYQNSCVKFNVFVDTLVPELLGYVPKSLNYSFDFDKSEVTLEWN